MPSNPRPPQSPRASANARWAKSGNSRRQYIADPRIDPAAFGPRYWARQPESAFREHYRLLIESGDDLRAAWLFRVRREYRQRVRAFVEGGGE